MYAFSQTPANGGEGQQGFELLELNHDKVGFSNGTKYQDYRHLIVDMTANFDITVQRLPGQGKPKFYVKMMNSQQGNYESTQLPRVGGYHFASAAHPEYPEYIQNLTLTPDMRTSRLGRCAFVKSSLQESGEAQCFLAISVQCEDGEECAYRIKVD